MKAILDRPKDLTVLDCCEALGVSRATLYRAEASEKASLLSPESVIERPSHFRALSEPETANVLEVLTSERFCEDAPREVYAALLDEKRYLCSISTMYRILWANAAVKERRNQLRHPAYSAPELLATKPNQVWSWDISVPRQAVWEMEVGPPESAYRSWFQTTISGNEQKSLS